jgi:hypothetical protein
MPRRPPDPSKRPKTKQNQPGVSLTGDRSDDFLSVARRLECDEDKGRFEAKLAKVAKALSKTVPR